LSLKKPGATIQPMPDLPGCISMGETIAETEAEIRAAMAFHSDGLREDGIDIPPAVSQVEHIEIAA
jgi:predicted RNase H-like HicB family nuclease